MVDLMRVIRAAFRLTAIFPDVEPIWVIDEMVDVVQSGRSVF